MVLVGWGASSVFMAERLTRRTGTPAGPAPHVAFARSEGVQLVARDGARVPAFAFDVDDARGTVVLLHPNGGSAASMLGAAEVWAELGYASLAPTLRAHGEALEPAPQNPIRMAAPLCARAALQQGPR